MDTPTITQYYREHDPMKRKALLEQSTDAGEYPEENRIRKELWEIRYKEASQVAAGGRADGFMALWMTMEFNRNSGGVLFGSRGAKKELMKQMEKLHFTELASRDGMYGELFYRECCHMVKMYMELCESDKSYSSALCGLISIGSDRTKEKIKKDIYETAVKLPKSLNMEQELGIVTRAAREMYELHFPGEGGL